MLEQWSPAPHHYCMLISAASSRQWAWGDGEVGGCERPPSFSGGEGKEEEEEAKAGGVGALPDFF